MAPVYFWREFEDAPYNFLSQWYGAAFTAPSPANPDETMTFQTTEQYMMYHKAMLFGDEEIADKIMKSDSPKTQKALGRKVKGFDGRKWDEHKSRIVEEGNWYKFTQQTKEKGLKEQLLETEQRELVEVMIGMQTACAQLC